MNGCKALSFREVLVVVALASLSWFASPAVADGDACHTLTVNYDDGMAEVDIVPDLSCYPDGQEVTLSVTCYDRVACDGWLVYDPNHPGDWNYAVDYPGEELTLIMDGDYEVECMLRYLSCGVGTGMPLLIIAAALGVMSFVRRTA